MTSQEHFSAIANNRHCLLQSMSMEMLTGQALGEALRAAIARKGVSQQQVADAFGVGQSSVAGWLKSGRIGKRHLVKLVSYFADVVGPEHWGLPAAWSELAPEAMAVAQLLDRFAPAERERIVPVLVALLGQLRRHPGASVAFTLIASGVPPAPLLDPPPPAPPPGADGAATPAPTVVPIRPPAPHR
jgi:predicted XRE-type DNA-binding protein